MTKGKTVKPSCITPLRERIKERLKEQGSSCNKDLRKATKKDRKIFLENIVREAEKDAIEQRKRDVYQIAKKLSGKRRKTNMAVKDKQGNLITSKKEKRARLKMQRAFCGSLELSRAK